MQVVVNIRSQEFKSSYIKLIVLLWSLVYSLLTVIISIASKFTMIGDNMTVFIIFGVVYLITAIVYILIRNVRKDCKCLKVIWMVDITYFIGGLFYYFGRNFPILARLFQNGGSCQNSIQIIQSILLGTVVVLYRFIPHFISKYYQSKLAKENQTTEAKLQLLPEWILAAESLTLLVEFDALYTVMINSFTVTINSLSETTNITNPFYCESGAQAIAAWVLWALFVLMYMFILYYTMNVQYCGNCNVNCSCVTSNLIAIVLLVAFGLFLLANNIVNSIVLSNSSIIILIMLIVMKKLVLIVVFTAIVLLLVYRCLSKTQQEKLLPRALYQHVHPEPDELTYVNEN